MPRGRPGTAKVIPPGTAFGTWVVIREVERAKNNRRFECHCEGCGTVAVRWLSNLVQARTGCLTCTPLSEVARPSLEAIVAEREARAQVTDEGRLCITCGEWKPWDKFPPDRHRRRGKSSNCLVCMYWRQVKSAYGITRAEWEWLFAKQDGKCALCHETDAATLHIDHDHACHPTGRGCKNCIRGLLCGNCNRLLGFVEVRSALLPRFADYLCQRPFASLAAGGALPVLKDVGTLGSNDRTEGLTDALR